MFERLMNSGFESTMNRVKARMEKLSQRIKYYNNNKSSYLNAED